MRFGFDPLVPLTKREESSMRDWLNHVRENSRMRSPIEGKVPWFKYVDAGLWHVSPEECEVISNGLQDLEALLKPAIEFLPPMILEHTEFFEGGIEWLAKNWAAYNETASHFGGYNVFYDRELNSLDPDFVYDRRDQGGCQEETDEQPRTERGSHSTDTRVSAVWVPMPFHHPDPDHLP